MKTKEHYDKHLAHFYSWMVGDWEAPSIAFQNLLATHGIKPKSTRTAIDLGAGSGIQSIAMKNLGYDVLAIDFNEQLLNELKANPKASGIKTELADITNVGAYEQTKPELIVCCGDTITHLENKVAIEKLITASAKLLAANGHLVLTFRDYTNELNDQQRFIPVKSTDDRILTCILEYQVDKIKVTDLLHEKSAGQWVQKVSTYEKVRIQPTDVVQMLEKNGLKIKLNEPIQRMQTIIAEKPIVE